MTPDPLPPLADAEIVPAMYAVMDAAMSLSAQPVGVMILGLVGFMVIFEALRVFLVKRQR